METAPTSAETLKPGPNPTNRLNRLEGSVESTEIWLPVPGYEGYYEVSDQGSVRGIERTIEYDGLVRRITSRVLRPNPRKDYGHLQVSLSRDGRSKTHLVHTLATEAFHEGHNIERLRTYTNVLMYVTCTDCGVSIREDT